MITTAYDYIALADLEAFTGMDYSGMDSTAFSDANVNKTIALAERIVNGYLGVTAAQTSTDGIITATTIIAAKLMYNKMVQKGYAVEGQEGIDLMQMSIKSVCKTFLDSDQSISVDNIPMSGANNDCQDGVS